MHVLGLMVLWLAILVIGDSVDRRPDRGRWLSRFGWAAATGAALLLCLLTILACLGLSTWLAWIAGGSIAVISRVRLSPKPPTDVAPPQRLQFEGIPYLPWLATLGFVVAVVSMIGGLFTQTLSDVDAYGIWQLKSTELFTQPLRPIPPALLDPGLSFSHQDYPPGIPLLMAESFRWLGRIDAMYLGGWNILFFTALTGILWSQLLQWVASGWAWCGAALLVASPIVIASAGTPTADFPLTLFYSAGLIRLLRWIESKQRAELALSMLFGVAAALTKNEGMLMLSLLAVGGAIAVAARRRGAVALGIAIAAAALAITPWLLYRRHLPHTVEDYGSRLMQPPTMSALLNAAIGMSRQLFVVVSAGPLWILMIVVVVWNARQRWSLAACVMAALLVLHLAAYTLVLSITLWQLDELLAQIGPKLLMHASPAALLLLAQTAVRSRS